MTFNAIIKTNLDSTIFKPKVYQVRVPSAVAFEHPIVVDYKDFDYTDEEIRITSGDCTISFWFMPDSTKEEIVEVIIVGWD